VLYPRSVAKNSVVKEDSNNIIFIYKAEGTLEGIQYIIANYLYHSQAWQCVHKILLLKSDGIQIDWTDSGRKYKGIIRRHESSFSHLNYLTENTGFNR